MISQANNGRKRRKQSKADSLCRNDKRKPRDQSVQNDQGKADKVCKVTKANLGKADKVCKATKAKPIKVWKMTKATRTRCAKLSRRQSRQDVQSDPGTEDNVTKTMAQRTKCAK